MEGSSALPILIYDNLQQSKFRPFIAFFCFTNSIACSPSIIDYNMFKSLNVHIDTVQKRSQRQLGNNLVTMVTINIIDNKMDGLAT